MYRNFNLTDEERKQIMEMHQSHGYKEPINESFGATWLTKFKIDSPQKLTDEQKHEMADKFQRGWNGLIAVEFEPGEWFNIDGKIENIEEYENYVNTEIYGKWKSPQNAEFEANIKKHKRNTEPDSPHQYQYSSYDDYNARKGTIADLPPAERKKAEERHKIMSGGKSFSFGQFPEDGEELNEGQKKLKATFNKFVINEQALTDNQRLAVQKGYGPVSAQYADQLGKEGKLLATAPNNQPAQNSSAAPAGSAAPAANSQAAEQPKQDTTLVNCAASLGEIKAGSNKILKHGCKTDAVKELQKMLGMEAKYHTGMFGRITKAKVIEFQKDPNNKDAEGNALVPDGRVGDKTYSALVKAKTPATTTTDPATTTADPTKATITTDTKTAATDSTGVKMNEYEEIDENLGKLIGTVARKGAQYVDDAIKYFKKPAQKGAFPVKQGVQKATDVYVPKSAQPALKNILQKYGSQRWSPSLNTALEPARQEMAIVTNDLKRLKTQLSKVTLDTKTKEQIYGLTYHLENVTNSNMTGCLRYDKGAPFDFNSSIGLVDQAIEFVDGIILSKRLSPENVRILQFMKENLNDASIKIQTGLTDLLTAK
jgi:hypothetical protein